jgi:hypothetical protein
MSSSKKILKCAFKLVGNGPALVAIASLVIMFIKVFTIAGSEQYILSKRSVSKSEVNSA